LLHVVAGGAPPDQAPRLRLFREEHPEVEVILRGPWQAIIPEPDGETVIVRWELMELLDEPAETGETLTEAVEIALRERLDREHARHAASMRTRLARLAADVAALKVADGRTPEEIIGYNDVGLSR
jgi:antitoxin VapB